tara:strand:- start:75 stop:878 length:804 start_codon:yes stop_codon:yes gene_type:complete
MSKQNNILNINNYNKTLVNVNIVIDEYHKLCNEYLIHIINQLIIKDNIHYLFVIERGFDLFKNIFVMLLHYTKNLELVIHHLRKSYLYYTEFIGQVGEDSNSFLQLNSKDACLFVYKKTIYDINEEFKKQYEMNEEDKEVFYFLKENVYLYTSLIKNICKYYVNDGNQFLGNNKNKIIKSIKVYMHKVVIELNNVDEQSCYEKIYLFMDYINNKHFQIDKKKSLLYHFIKKINSSTIEKKKLYKLMLEDEEYSKLTPIKYINRLFRK